jgi:hypothetical protein
MRCGAELTVGGPGYQPLIDGGQDLDNCLFPIAQQLSPRRIAARFGRKTHGPSWLAVGPAEPDQLAAPPLFSARMTGSYERTAWKQLLHDRLVQAGVRPVRPGPADAEIAVTTGPAQLGRPLKTLIDAFGPVLGEDPLRPFHPRDDRISLGLQPPHHRRHRPRRDHRRQVGQPVTSPRLPRGETGRLAQR